VESANLTAPGEVEVRKNAVRVVRRIKQNEDMVLSPATNPG
jgi:hypothetical protein